MTFTFEDRVILEQSDIIGDTFDFMDLAGQLDGVQFGTDPKAPHRKLRRKMLADVREGEVGEFLDADFGNDIVEYLDGAADVIVVALGAIYEACSGNYQLARAVLAEVARSNLSKFDSNGKPILNKDGKVQKGPNFSPPRIRELVEYYGIEVPPISPEATFVATPDEPTVIPGATDSTGKASIPQALRGPNYGKVSQPTDKSFERPMTSREFGDSMTPKD